jgi:hypothetical protein
MNCPNCKTSWIGEEIPKGTQKYYASTHWLRYIGIDGGYMGVYDGTVAIKCPDCNEEFPPGNSEWELEMFDKYKEKVRD